MYEFSTLELIGAIVGSIFGSQALSILVTRWVNKKREDTDAAAVTVDSTLKWAEALNNRVTKLETDLDAMRKENLELHKEVSALRAEVSFYKAYYPAPPTPAVVK